MKNEFKLTHKIFFSQKYSRALLITLTIIIAVGVFVYYNSRFDQTMKSWGGIPGVLREFSTGGNSYKKPMIAEALNRYLNWDFMIHNLITIRSKLFFIVTVIYASLIAGTDYNFKTIKYKTVYSNVKSTYLSQLLYTIIVTTIMYLFFLLLVVGTIWSFLQFKASPSIGIENLDFLKESIKEMGYWGLSFQLYKYLVLLYGYMMFLVLVSFSLTKIFKSMYVPIFSVIVYYYVFNLNWNLNSIFNFSSWINSIELFIYNGEHFPGGFTRSSVALSHTQGITLLITTSLLLVIFSYIINVKIDGGKHGN